MTKSTTTNGWPQMGSASKGTPDVPTDVKTYIDTIGAPGYGQGSDGARMTRARFAGQVMDSAEKLRALADRLARLSATVGEKPDKDAVTVASDVVHEVTWATANLNLSVLIESAHRADEARRF